MLPSHGGKRRGSPFGFRLSFKSFAYLLFLLALLLLSPSLFFNTTLRRLFFKGRIKHCDWLQHPPLVCAHGGDTSRAPPNTFISYKLALDNEVDCIEIDASRTRDGVLVALHDRDLQAFSGNSALHVGDLTLDQIKKLDAGSKFLPEFQQQKVPVLEDALRNVSRFLKKVVIDVKVGPPLFEDGLAKEVLSVVNHTGCNNCVVWSKIDGFVKSYVQLSSNHMTGYIVMNDFSGGQMMNASRIEEADVVGIYHGLVDTTAALNLHRENKKVYVWTVNEKHIMEEILFSGVDCIITSYPRVLKELMAQIKEQCEEEGY